ncbi:MULTISPECIES: sigma-E factor negative regulatory protein [unclassified Janthinobacterium]|uniref:sigma-E factor negative regulatory protein n=1 Tax=unclassified Janthinobacterium TaxID=2610881 RepID=UPI000345F8E1|nr:MULTISPECIES: sigma-E factor negative regulatory protein [unclassified Janthinobacterium]MEC5162549.1 sigma-E factor negative regulatory protein RseA [Janthinobacterium sp. CG_S6]
MDTQKQLHETISALADGELAASEVELAFAALDTPEGRAAWSAYHQIGHTLRSDGCGGELSEGFAARMATALAAEPPLRAPLPSPASGADGASAAPDRVTSLP